MSGKDVAIIRLLKMATLRQFTGGFIRKPFQMLGPQARTFVVKMLVLANWAAWLCAIHCIDKEKCALPQQCCIIRVRHDTATRNHRGKSRTYLRSNAIDLARRFEPLLAEKARGVFA